MTTTQIRSVGHLLDVEPWLGDFVADFDVAAIRDDLAAALSAGAGEGIYVSSSGLVFAEVEHAERARAIDWAELAGAVDLVAIAARHEIARAGA